jgi:hypothetical protein
MNDTQELFSHTSEAIIAIQTTITPIRFNRYLTAAKNDPTLALELYRWNSFLAQSLYWPTQTLEVASRNSIANVITSRFGRDWHFSEKFRRQLSREDTSKLEEAIGRQKRERRMPNPSVDVVIADLSFGFWTSMLTAHYAIPLSWKKNLPAAFPYMPANLPLRSAQRPMEDVRILRNRIAHHEPIFDRRLDISYGEIMRLIGWICPASQAYVERTSLFPNTWSSCPIENVRGGSAFQERRK